MAEYRISGVWKDENNIITHYALHTVQFTKVSWAVKTDINKTVMLLENTSNIAHTWVWNYKKSIWNLGEKVSVVNGDNGKYLKSNPNNIETDHLAHLIDYDWLE